MRTIALTRQLKIQNEYTKALLEDLKDYAYDEERAPQLRGRWRQMGFGPQPLPESAPLDLEIGTGRGVFFTHHLSQQKDRYMVGLELKYKPLIQTIRGLLNHHLHSHSPYDASHSPSKNQIQDPIPPPQPPPPSASLIRGRVARFHAFNIPQLFSPEEVNDIYIHFPDPWTSPNKPKNRILNHHLLDEFWKIQRPHSLLEFKTDSSIYFDWALKQIHQSSYKNGIEDWTRNLYNGPSPESGPQRLDDLRPREAHQVFDKSEGLADPLSLPPLTGFERIFVHQGLPIHRIRLRRRSNP